MTYRWVPKMKLRLLYRQKLLGAGDYAKFRKLHISTAFKELHYKKSAPHTLPPRGVEINFPPKCLLKRTLWYFGAKTTYFTKK